MADLFVAYDNFFDSATLAGGSWEGTLPLANLQKQQPSTVARTTNDAEASTILTIDLGARKSINVVSLIHHNLSNAATWQIQIGNDSGYTTNLVDTGAVDVVDATEAFGELQWGAFTWGGKPTNAVLATFRPIAFYYSATPVLARYVKIIISDTSNGDNYVEFGRVYVAAAFTPANNIAYGLETSFVDNSRSVISRGGQVYVDTVPKRRRFGFRFHYMDEDEAFTEANEIQRLKGLSGDVLMAIDVDDATHRMRQSCYGRLADLQPLTAETTGHFAMDMAIEELI